MKLKHKILIICCFVAGCASVRPQVTSPGGIVNIENNSAEAVEIFVDGSRTAVVDPGDSVKVDRLITGNRRITAVGVVTGENVERMFDLTADEATSWTVGSRQQGLMNDSATGCMLDVVNKTADAQSVVINDSMPVQIAAGKTTRLTGLRTGTAAVTSTGATSGLVRTAEIQLRPDVTPSLEILNNAGAVRFHNRSGHLATVSADGEVSARIDNGKTFTFADIKNGIIRYYAIDPGKRFLGVYDVEVRKGQTTDVIINQPAGTLNVVSDIDAPVNVFADGVLLGTCPANGGATFTGLVMGNNNLKAVHGNRNVVAKTWMQIKPEVNLWFISDTKGTEIRAGTGMIEVINPAREKLDLYVDSNMSGIIKPRKNRLVPNLAPGIHSAAVIGKISGSVVTAEITVREGRKSVWKVSMPTSTITVNNSAAEAVNVYSDARLAGTVPASQSKLFPLSEGEHRIEVTGVETMTGIARTMVLAAGTASLINYAGPHATLVATNRFPDPVEVRINERMLGTLNPGERVTVNDINPGNLRLNAVSIKRPVSMTVMINLAAGDAFDWTIEQ